MDVSTTQLAATTRRLDLRLPFPFTDCARFAEDDTAHLPAIESCARAIANPKYIVYAAYEPAGGATDRIAAIESMDDTAVLLHVRDGDARLASIPRDTLTRAVAEALDAVGAFKQGSLFEREVDVPAPLLDETDPDVVAAGLREARLGLADVEAWLAAGRSRASGVLGVVGYSSAGGHAGGHHVSRSVSWRSYAAGGVLAVEQSKRSRHVPLVSLRALTSRSVNRVAVDLLASVGMEMGPAARASALSGTGGA